jgi:predicted HTH transcriptional regulator
VEEILQLLDAADFDALIGAVETAEIDFKRSPYRLNDAAEAFELAKDVTALANTEAGGILVIGFQTRSPEESGLDTVETVHPFARSLFNRDQWLAKVHQLAYPTVVGLDAVFKSSADDPDRGVAVIVVPAQAPDSRYFVVAKQFVTDDGAPGWMIGLSVRSGDRNRPLSIGEIHALVSRSLHLGTDVAELKALVRDLHEANAAGVGPREVPADALADRINRAIDAMQEQ